MVERSYINRVKNSDSEIGISEKEKVELREALKKLSKSGFKQVYSDTKSNTKTPLVKKANFKNR